MFSSCFFHFSVFGAFWRFFVVLGGFGPYVQTPWRFLRRLRSVSSQKTQTGPVTGQNKISKKLENLSNKRSVDLDKFSRFSYFIVKICCHVLCSSSDSGNSFRFSGAFCIDSVIFRYKMPPWGRSVGQNNISKKHEQLV